MTRYTLPLSFQDTLFAGTTTKVEILANLKEDTGVLASLRKDAAARALVTVSAFAKPGLERFALRQRRRNRIMRWLGERLGRTNPSQPQAADAHTRIVLAKDNDSIEWDETLKHRPVAHGLLYDLTAAGRMDVLRVGRFPSQDFPLVDRYVSREHGLALYLNGAVYYCDYGTFFTDDAAREDGRMPGRHGSRNGTWIRDASPIRDTLIRWDEADELGLGDVIKASDGSFVRMIRLSYGRISGRH